MKIGITERGDAGLDFSWMQPLAIKSVDAAILITKAPYKLLGLNLPKNIIVHCTITGLGQRYEPGVATTETNLNAYDTLVRELGPDRVVLRVDPIIPVGDELKRAMDVIAHAKGRIRISFMDMYPHVKDRFRKAGIEIPYHDFHASKHIRIAAYNAICEMHESLAGKEYSVEVCGEPDLFCTGCVSRRDLEALELEGGTLGGKQRYACCCLAEKVELLKDRKPCAHGCLYCYWR